MEKALYGFCVSDKGKLIRNIYRNYTIKEQGNHQNYRFQKESGIVTKRDDQLDRYLNGYLYTFNPDPIQARNIICNTLEEKMAKAKEELIKCGNMLDLITASNIDEDFMEML